jgi:hypothetical protein
MKIAREKIEQLQKLAKDKGGDIASKASQKVGEIPGLKEIPGAGAVSRWRAKERKLVVAKFPISAFRVGA